MNLNDTTAKDLMIYFGPDAIRAFIDRVKYLPPGVYRHALAAETFGRKGIDVLAHMPELSVMLYAERTAAWTAALPKFMQEVNAGMPLTPFPDAPVRPRE